MEAEEAATKLKAPGVPEPGERDRAITIARVLLQAPNLEPASEISTLARAFLREVGLSP